MRGDYLMVKSALSTTSFDEARGEKIEQLRMRRRFTQLPKIIRRRNDSFAEHIVPQSIHHDPRR